MQPRPASIVTTVLVVCIPNTVNLKAAACSHNLDPRPQTVSTKRGWFQESWRCITKTIALSRRERSDVA